MYILCSSVKSKLDEENSLMQRDKELKEILEKKKSDILQSQKKDMDLLTAQNDAFKSELEDKLRYWHHI